MAVTLDTSHRDMSPLNELGTPSKNSQLISVTAEISQDPIGPCRPLEQSEESFRHSVMAAFTSVLDFGARPVVVYSRGYTVKLRRGLGLGPGWCLVIRGLVLEG